MDDDCDTLYPPRCVSYLQARDPSILSWNRHGILEVRQNLESEFSSESTIATIPSNSSEKSDEGLNVHLRIKGGVPANHLYTVEDNTLICAVPNSSNAARIKHETTAVFKKYKFTNIFGPGTSQADLFDTIIKDKMLNFINGKNCTLMAYGVSGSGKTFTMVGTAEQPGIVPRSLDYLFRTVSKSANRPPKLKPLPNKKIELLSDINISQEIDNLRNILHDSQAFNERSQHIKTYNEMQRRLSNNQVGIVNVFPPIIGVWVSFAEIYNESIYDLLLPLPGRGQQRAKLKIGGLQDDTYIRGLKSIYVRSGLEAYQILQYGLHNLSYAATAVNQHSSRSHFIFSIKLVAGYDEKNCNVSVFNFCDLAGSERLKKTMNEGDRLKESTKINTSLSVLGRCINCIRDMQQNANGCNAPFRESKLTQLFQKALQGKEDILMIVNINPDPSMFDDTQQALMFSAVAKQIVTQVAPLKILKPNRFSTYRQQLSLYMEEEEDERDEELRALRDHRARLVLELSELKERCADIIEMETTHLRTNYEALIKLKDGRLSELDKELNELKLVKEQLEKETRQLQRELYMAEASSQVIVLSSSGESDSDEDDDAADPLNVSQQNYQNNIENFKKLEEELERLKNENNELSNAKNEMSNRIIELEGILNDAKSDVRKLVKGLDESRAEVAELTSKNVMLEDQIIAQNAELEHLRLHALPQCEEIRCAIKTGNGLVVLTDNLLDL